MANTKKKNKGIQARGIQARGIQAIPDEVEINATVLDLFSRCGTTPDEARKFFKKQKIKGKRANHTGCPIAKWLQKKGIICAIDGQTVWWYTLNGLAHRVQIPTGLQSFIILFDNGCYPELECNDAQ